MTETLSDEKIVISAEATPVKESIVPRKTIVYETLVDPTVIRVASEKLKHQLFTRFGLLKPKPEEIQFVSIDKYYEPYIVVSGKYLIDYYRKCVYTVKVDGGVLEVILLKHKFVPEQAASSTSKDGSFIRLEGEERLVNEAKASFILDKYGRDATLERLPSAPSEKNPKKVIAKFGIEEVAENVDVDFVRDRLVKRPKDINRIVNEIFEVAERVVIYTPRFRLSYKNVKTGEEKALEFDGVTSNRIQQNEGAISQSMRIIKSRLK
ncbi:MAG: hypothetical protein ACUVUE_05335 [Candidatus Bathycorpusculaceae bacterium]